MSDLAYLQNAAKQLSKLHEELEQDLKTDPHIDAYARACTLEAWCKQLTEDELRVVLGPAYSTQARFWLAGRVMSHVMHARVEMEKAHGIYEEPAPLDLPDDIYTEGSPNCIKRGDWTGD